MRNGTRWSNSDVDQGLQKLWWLVVRGQRDGCKPALAHGWY